MAEQSHLNEEKSSGRNWTDSEKDLVWEEATRAKQDGQPLTEAFRHISRLLPHRSEAAIGMLYYNVLRKERQEEETASPSKPATSQPASNKSSHSRRELKIDSELIEAFQGLPEYIHQLQRRLDSLEDQIAQPSVESIAKAMLHLSEGYQQSDTLNDQVDQLKDRISELERENQKLVENIRKMEQAYQDALGIYDLFTNMASISQIMSLGDFKQQMKTTLDKWGNVLKVSFEKAE